MPERRPVSVTRFERKLRAVLGYSGSGLLQGAEDHLQGIVVLELDRPEWALAGGERLFTGQVVVGVAAAGNFAHANIANPANTGVLVVVERLNFIQPAGQRIDYFADQGPVFTNRTAGGDRDRRSPIVPTAGIGGSAVGVLPVSNFIHVSGVSLQDVGPTPYILAPGHDLGMWAAIDATSLSVGLVWREVPLEGSLLG